MDPIGPFDLLNGSRSTAGMRMERSGEPSKDKMEEGMRWRPNVRIVSVCGIYRKRALAGAAVVGTVITLSSNLSK